MDSNAQIPAHVQRVIDECNEVVDRAAKLDTFIGEDAIFNTLDPIDQDLLCVQHMAIETYVGILRMRLKRAGVDLAT